MKQIIKTIYKTYHALFPSDLGTCRFQPTCSEYLLEAVEKYGVVLGLFLFGKRLMSCHPFSKRPIIDSV